MTKTINISISGDDLKRIDDYCLLHNLSRSKFFLQSVLEKIDVADMIDSLDIISKTLSSASIKGVLSDSDMSDLKTALRLVKGE